MVQRNFFSVNGGKTTSDIGLYLPFPAGIYLLQTSEKFMKLVQNQQKTQERHQLTHYFDVSIVDFEQGNAGRGLHACFIHVNNSHSDGSNS